ncbi:glycoside hydrolase family 88/105 protein [Polyangium aurulentum]|uniref:glycoside hydrolase family 88/105 protein n=1 Tax=Polyangium aurulentum TaxID=2567896 RepID=UPI0023DEDDC3|nr:glycoside hydrolase family 88 protein [Polyangium aurulentum]
MDSQLWADGVYMVLPFLAGYGVQFGQRASTDEEVARQLLIYAHHLQGGSGLLYHAWDEKRAQPWADPATGRSPEPWCRAIGWYGMTAIDILEMIPANHPRRRQVITLVQDLVRAFQRYQDAQTGRWFQVVNKGDLPGNWTETSCSCMYTFVTSRAVQRGYVDRTYGSVAARGYRGVLDKISLDEHGMVHLVDTSIGTVIGDLRYYLARDRVTNDLHGLGAFLIMNEQMRGM